MNINEMPAGKEMDELVAEKVMGWRLNESGFWYDGDKPMHCGSYPPHPAYAECNNRYFKPSTDIRDAWTVFMEILDPNRHSIHPCGNGQEGLWWAVYYDDEMIVYANNAPLAICRAALKAFA